MARILGLNVCYGGVISPDVLKRVWGEVFPDSFSYWIVPRSRNVIVKCSNGDKVNLNVKLALKLGPEKLLLRTKSVRAAGMEKSVKDRLERNGPKVSVVCSSVKRNVMVSTFRVTNLETGKCFVETGEYFIKNPVYGAQKNASAIKAAEYKDRGLEFRESTVKKHLERLDSSGSLSYEKSTGQNVFLKNIKSGKTIEIYANRLYLMKTKDELIRYWIAKVRWNSTRSVPYTDSQWKAYIEKISNGRITADRYIPDDRKLVKTETELRCTRCDLKFVKIRLGNLKNPVIRCPDCDHKNSKRYSLKAVEWLVEMEKTFNIKIRKATDTGGEKKVKLRSGATCVDGYNEKYNIVFEFHGSRWHGDPHIFYSEEKCSPYSATSALGLLVKTLKREKEIFDAGFNYIRIWDQDFIIEERYSQWLLRNTPRIKKFLTPQ